MDISLSFRSIYKIIIKTCTVNYLRFFWLLFYTFFLRVMYIKMSKDVSRFLGNLYILGNSSVSNSSGNEKVVDFWYHSVYGKNSDEEIPTLVLTFYSYNWRCFEIWHSAPFHQVWYNQVSPPSNHEITVTIYFYF